MKKQTAFNIFSIIDIDDWRQEFFNPVSLKTRDVVAEELCCILRKVYENAADEEKVFVRISTKAIYLELYDLLVKHLAVEGMRSCADREFVATNHRWPHGESLSPECATFELYKGSEKYDFYDLYGKYEDRGYLQEPSWKKIGRRGKSLWEQLQNFPQRAAEYFINPNPVTLEYVKKNCERPPVLVRPELIFFQKNSPQHDNTYAKIFDDIATEISEQSDVLLTKLTGKRLATKIKSDLKKAIVWNLTKSSDDLNRARKYCQKIPVGSRLFTGTAKYYTRVISEAFREKDGEVIGCPHAGGLCGLYAPWLMFTEFATCTSFLCLDKKDKESYEALSVINPIKFKVAEGVGTSILNVNSPYKKELDHIPLENISTIMYVCYGLHYYNYGPATRTDTVGMDLHLKVIDYLLTFGKKIIVKLSPKNVFIGDNFNHFGYYGDRVHYSRIPFTQTLDQADMFILEGLGSNVLLEAMSLTDKPVLLLKPPSPKTQENLDSILNKRCFVADLYEDEQNRLCFEKEQLKKVFSLKSRNQH